MQGYLAGNNPLLPGAIAAILSAGMWYLGVWQPLERLGYTELFKIRPEPGWDKRIAVIGIDEKSLKEYGQFPWQRDRYVELLQALETSKPAAIGFDILFLDPSLKDEMVAQAIEADGKVVLASAGENEEPVPILKDAAAAIGHILHEPDADGVSRQITIGFNGVQTFGLAMLHVSEDRTFTELLKIIPPQSISEPYEDLDLKNVWINWPGKMQKVPTYPFVDIVNGQFPEDAFTNKLVLVGFVATGVDRKISPLQPIAGVYLHAAFIDNWLNQRFLKRPPDFVEILLLIGISMGMSWVQFNRALAGRLAAAFILPVVWFAIALIAFTWGNWWLPIAAPIGTMIIAGTAVQLRDQYEKQQLLKLFAKQISPEMAQIVWQRKAEIFQNGDLPPQELIATVLFMDIRSFTSISEHMSPRELLPWLNEYLDAMSGCIMDKGGVIDKYIGDAIMAVFGVPFPHNQPEDVKRDAMNAIAACLAMHEKLKPLNKRLKAEGKPMIQIGIGMHTGPLIAGSVGGSRRANYSVLGDTVNVAARVEPMNKQILDRNPYNLLVTADTFGYVSDRYLGQQVGQLQLRGKQQETTIFSIMGERTDTE